MIKIFLIIYLLIGLSFSQNNSALLHKNVCNQFVSLDQKHYLIKGRNDEIINCYFKSGKECVYNHNKVSVKLIVNNISYDFGSVDCKRQAFDLQQEKCHMKILFGIEDLKANNLMEDEFNVSCAASFNTEDGVVEGESNSSYLKLFRGELFNSACSDTKPCIANRNITCNQNLCRCKNGKFRTYIDNYGITSCAQPVKHNEHCLNSQICKDYNSRCVETSLGKLCQCINGYYWNGEQCKYGYESKRTSCPSCECNQVSCFNAWSFILNVMIFICGIIAGIFPLKTCMCCIEKKNADESYVIENSQCLKLDTEELGKKLNEKLNNKFESMKNFDKIDNLENVKVKY